MSDNGITATERRTRTAASLLDHLDHLSARILMERMPIPLLSLGKDNVVVYSNPAFAAMLGYDVVTGMAADALFANAIDEPGKVIALRHSDGSVVRAIVSGSLLLRADDPLNLVAFHDVTDQLWAHNDAGGDPFRFGN